MKITDNKNKFIVINSINNMDRNINCSFKKLSIGGAICQTGVKMMER